MVHLILHVSVFSSPSLLVKRDGDTRELADGAGVREDSESTRTREYAKSERNCEKDLRSDLDYEVDAKERAREEGKEA